MIISMFESIWDIRLFKIHLFGNSSIMIRLILEIVSVESCPNIAIR